VEVLPFDNAQDRLFKEEKNKWSHTYAENHGGQSYGIFI